VLVHSILQNKVQIPELHLKLQVQLVVEVGRQSVLCGLSVLTHHNDGRLHSANDVQHKVQEDVRKGIERCKKNLSAVQHHPNPYDKTKEGNEPPAPAEFSDMVCNPISQAVVPVDFFIYVASGVARVNSVVLRRRVAKDASMASASLG
jgi:hypothetical protein